MCQSSQNNQSSPFNNPAELQAAIAGMEPSNDTPLVGEAAARAGRYASMDAETLLDIAAEWDDWRRRRAAYEIANYQLDRSTGDLYHLRSDKMYQCEDARQWEALPGVIVWVGCDCEDECFRLRPLRKAMQDACCGAVIRCKHAYIRLLLAGHTVEIAGRPTRATRRLLERQK